MDVLHMIGGSVGRSNSLGRGRKWDEGQVRKWEGIICASLEETKAEESGRRLAAKAREGNVK